MLSLATFVFPAALTIVVTPILVHYLGVDYYGIFVLSGVLMSFVALTNLGVAPALLKFVSEYAAKQQLSEINVLIGVSLLLSAVVGCIGVLISFVVAFFFLSDLFDLTAEQQPTAKFAFVLAGLTYLVSALLGVLASVPVGLQRFGVSAALKIGLHAPTALCTVLAAYLGFGLRGVMVVALAGHMVGLVVFTWVNRRLLPGFRPVLRWNSPVLLRLFSFSAFTFVANVAGVVLFQLDKILIGALDSVAGVTYYTIPGGLAQTIHAAVASLAVVALPLSSDLIARGDIARVRQLYVRATRFVVLFTVSVSIPLYVFSEKILLYWLGPTFADKSTAVLRILILTYGMLALTAIPYYLALGANKPWVPAVFSIFTAVLNVGLVLVLIPRFGIVGAAVGYLASTAAVPFFVWYFERRVLGVTQRIWLELLRKLALPAVWQVLVCYLAITLVTNVAVLLVVLAATSMVLPVLYYAFGFFDDEDKALLKRLALGRGQLRSRVDSGGE